jgi:hypothetical protein
MTQENSDKELNARLDDIIDWKEIDHWFSVTENSAEPYGDKLFLEKEKAVILLDNMLY